MNSFGFVKTSMPEETRVGLLPADIKAHINNPQALFFETGYAKHLGIADKAYLDAGANVVSRDKAYDQTVLCIPKPWINDIDFFQQGQTIMGWLYLSEKKKIAEAVLEKKMTAISWENMYDPDKNYVFDKNRWYAGYVSTAQALPFANASPKNLNIGVLGRGRVAKGAIAKLEEEGATYDLFGRDGYDEFMSKLPDYDVAINCWYYDPAVGNYLTLEDLQEMKAGALLIDVASEGVEGSIPHPAISPLYHVGRFNPIIIYNNNHAPTMWPLETSQAISEAGAPYIDKVINGETDAILNRATVVKEGQIIDKRIETLLGIK